MSGDLYKLTCWRCDREVEIVCDQPAFRCPRCSAELEIFWQVYQTEAEPEEETVTQ